MTISLKEILKALADGQFRSGQSLGMALGVSRAAVWKHLQQAGRLGIAVETKAGQGYRIAGGLDLLDLDRIMLGLEEGVRRIVGRVVVLDTIDSTNNYARSELCKERGWLAVLAESQTAGRGRLGREWVSPYGRNLYLSLGCTFADGVTSLQGISLVVGVAVHRALAKLAIAGLGLKWPNDILLNGKKLGGILLEVAGDPAGHCEVVVGIGLNVKMPCSVACSISQPWADMSGYQITRNQLAANILSELVPALHGFPKTTFAGYRDEWQRYDAYRNALINVINNDKIVQGVARGVSDAGALRVDVDGRDLEFSGGEISLRRLV